jgi:hypothetical protein
MLGVKFKGKDLARKAAQLTHMYQQPITIEKGREIFVAMPEKDPD